MYRDAIYWALAARRADAAPPPDRSARAVGRVEPASRPRARRRTLAASAPDNDVGGAPARRCSTTTRRARSRSPTRTSRARAFAEALVWTWTPLAARSSACSSSAGCASRWPPPCAWRWRSAARRLLGPNLAAGKPFRAQLEVVGVGGVRGQQALQGPDAPHRDRGQPLGGDRSRRAPEGPPHRGRSTAATAARSVRRRWSPRSSTDASLDPGRAAGTNRSARWKASFPPASRATCGCAPRAGRCCTCKRSPSADGDRSFQARTARAHLSCDRQLRRRARRRHQRRRDEHEPERRAGRGRARDAASAASPAPAAGPCAAGAAAGAGAATRARQSAAAAAAPVPVEPPSGGMVKVQKPVSQVAPSDPHLQSVTVVQWPSPKPDP